MTNKKTTIDGMMIWADFRDDEERLEHNVLIETQVFNQRLGIADNQWACFVVPAGSSTNGASWSPITTTLLWLHKRDPSIRRAALGHDEMYRSAGKPIEFRRFDRRNRKALEKVGVIELSRKEADKFIRVSSKETGANLYQRWMIYLGLKIGGGKSWKRYFKFNT